MLRPYKSPSGEVFSPPSLFIRLDTFIRLIILGINFQNIFQGLISCVNLCVCVCVWFGREINLNSVVGRIKSSVMRGRESMCVQGDMLGQLCLFHIAQTTKTITLDEIFGCTDIEIWELSPVHWCPWATCASLSATPQLCRKRWSWQGVEIPLHVKQWQGVERESAHTSTRTHKLTESVKMSDLAVGLWSLSPPRPKPFRVEPSSTRTDRAPEWGFCHLWCVCSPQSVCAQCKTLCRV